jgi:hypothetical protein
MAPLRSPVSEEEGAGQKMTVQCKPVSAAGYRRDSVARFRFGRFGALPRGTEGCVFPSPDHPIGEPRWVIVDPKLET